MLELCRNEQRKRKNKRRTKGASLLRNPLTMHKMRSLASQCTLKIPPPPLEHLGIRDTIQYTLYNTPSPVDHPGIRDTRQYTLSSTPSPQPPLVSATRYNIPLKNSPPPLDHPWYQRHDTLYITRPNCALDRRTILCLYVPGFQRQVFKHVKTLSKRSKKNNKQKKNKRSVLAAESAYNAQKAQFGLVM